MTNSTPFALAAERVRAGAETRVEAADLVSQLTDDELLNMLDGDVPLWSGLGDMSSGGYHNHSWPAAVNDRLGIPGLHFSDGPRGVVLGTATCFPVPMARGAAFDLELEEAIGDAIGKELRASGANYFGGVCVNLLRHPAWGRAQETYGEDPHHVGEFGAALTRGVQRHAMACVKHFALNSMENARFTVDVTCDDRALHEVYLPHFRRIVDEGVASVMSSYNSVNGEWAGQNHALLTKILRDEWNFDGFVITDFLFGLRDAAKSVHAGLDIEMPFRQQRAAALPAALAAGELTRSDLEAPAIRTVATFLRFADVLAAATPPPSVLVCDDHRALARRAAVEAIVLLRNEGNLLPLSAADLSKVAVVGQLAAIANLGDGGSSDVSGKNAVTPLAGLVAALPGVDVVHSEDASAATGADVVIVVVGYTKADEGEFIDGDVMASMTTMFPAADDPLAGTDAPSPEFAEPHEPFVGSPEMASGGDRRSLRLHAEDEALIAAAVAANPNTVVAVMGGSAVVMPWADSVPALLQLWYPGQEGGHALADIVLGAEAPSGRLPFAIPHHEADLVSFNPDAEAETYGLLHGQWHLDANATPAHYPFGFGLGTTTFELLSTTHSADVVTVTVRNSGTRAGTHVVQLYGSGADSVHERPSRRLVGFARVAIAAGTEASIDVAIDLRVLDARVDGAMQREDATISLIAASHAADPGLFVS